MEIVKLDLFSCHDIVLEIASIYKKVFGGEPWNEGWLCPVCKENLPLSVKITSCPTCDKQGKSVLLMEFWTTTQIITDLYRELCKPKAECFIAKENNCIVGFAWGYLMSVVVSPPNETNPIDLTLDAPGLGQIISGEYFYLDECAVLEEHRGQGIGKKLTETLCHSQTEIPKLLRTKHGSIMENLVTGLGGKTLLKISRERVIMTIG